MRIRARGRAIALSAVALVGAGTVLSGCGSAAGNDGSKGGKSATNARAATLAEGRSAAAGGDCGADAKLMPKCGAYWGIYSVQGKSLTSAVTDIEGKVGRRFDIVLRFHDWSNAAGPGRFPDASERVLGGSRLLFFAWESKVYQKQQSYKWRDIAAGAYDKSVVEPVAERVRAYGKKVFMSFDPEMDRHQNKGEMKGSPAEYVAAARHVHDVFQRAGVKNVVWVWVTTGTMSGVNPQRMLDSYPGDAYVDWVGWDPYNFYKCHNGPWHTFDEKVGPTYRFFQQHGLAKKPFILPEYGTQYDPADPKRSIQWYREIPGVLRAKYPNIAGLIRFDAGPGCNLKVDNGPGMLGSYAAAGRDTYLNTSGH
ncbi:glycosyl hydrolase [Actinoallomurus sp. NPDC052308]|uniref:glycoside hydrolase family 26 protein n=1 Tax=Actinoallomurus sp. NPDC052308 TaxID=3155530 RepID=UPI003420AEC3